ncbi:MAG: porin family protein [Flavobacteriaceae bacterium]
MKRIFVVLFVTCSLLTVHAQKSKREEGIKLGIKGGLNVSNLSGDIKDVAIRTSIHLGLLAEIIVTDKFSIQPELMYSGQGATVTSTGGGRLKYDYVNLPVLAKFPVANGLSFEAGPQLGFLVSAKYKTNDSNDKIEDTKTLDFGLGGGLEYELKNGVIFQARYNLGLTNINSASDNFRVSNNVIQASVGYLF